MTIFRPLIVIALYNQPSTVRKVIEESLLYCPNLLLVDDGSQDDIAPIIKDLNIGFISYAKNRGKGYAIAKSAQYAKKYDYTHILTIDADAQHYPSDIPKLLNLSKENNFDIIIGKRDFESSSIPRLSKFGRRFSSFWARVQTGKKIIDIQSGFRVYPLEVFDKFKIFSQRFGFEVEIVVKAIWSGFSVKEIPVKVYYPKKSERISHFRLFQDNARLAVLNTYLTIRAMIPIAHRKYMQNNDGETISLNPFKVILSQLKNKKEPFHLGISAAWGCFWGALALPGIRNFFLFVGVGWFNLNRLVAFSVDKLAIPPFIPFVCIEVGYYLRHGEFLTELSWQIIGRQFLQRIWEWILGSLIVAPIFAVLVGTIIFVLGHILRKGVLYGSKMDGKKPKQ
ncbi:MAG: glycosyltransferase family 2 protein [Elusimicrobiota bacterium]|jgi:glycosyltransferase involved in cell wall biosynthesis|nr:glycosyltransferase family 2 protein [Elusimicrobiota bacterium]